MGRGVPGDLLRRDRFFQLGLVLVALVVVAAVLAPWVAPFDPLKGDLRNAYLLGPGGRFALGTDTQGRDVLSRVLYGARLSLSVGLIRSRSPSRWASCWGWWPATTDAGWTPW